MPKKIKIKASFINCMFVLILMILMSVSVSAASSAEFVGTDETTRGDWVGKYGNDGNVVIAFADMFPKTVKNYSVDVTGEIGYYEWWSTAYNPQNYSDTDISRREPGALILYAQKNTRVAGCYYAAQDLMVDIDVGSETKIVSLYMLDYDEYGRKATVYVYDEEGRELAKPVSVDMYDKGVYLQYKISGAVSFMLENEPPPEINVCLSGIFFDPAPVSDTAVTAADGVNQASTDTKPGNGKNNDIFALIMVVVLTIIITTPIVIVKRDMNKNEATENN